MKVKKGDEVKIISGKDRGKRGKVVRVIPGESKIVVEGVNIVKKHLRPKKSGEKGQRVEISAPIDASNAMVICSRCGKSARIGYKVSGDKKFRVCKKCRNEM